MCREGELLSAAQLLWVNLVTDGLPAMALVFTSSKAAANGKARGGNRDAPIISRRDLLRILVIGVCVATATLLSTLIDPEGGVDERCGGRRTGTLALTAMILAEMTNALSSSPQPLANPWLVLAVSLSVLLHFAITRLSWLQDAFGVCPLSLKEWVQCAGLGIPLLIVDAMLFKQQQ